MENVEVEEVEEQERGEEVLGEELYWARFWAVTKHWEVFLEHVKDEA